MEGESKKKGTSDGVAAAGGRVGVGLGGAQFGHLDVGRLVLVAQQRVQERVDEVRVGHLFGQAQQRREQRVQLRAPLLGHHLHRTAAQVAAFGRTCDHLTFQ